MPAITVNDLTTLDRVRTPGLGDQPRKVRQVTTAPQGYEGEGFPVRRAFAGIDLETLARHLVRCSEQDAVPDRERRRIEPPGVLGGLQMDPDAAARCGGRERACAGAQRQQQARPRSSCAYVMTKVHPNGC